MADAMIYGLIGQAMQKIGAVGKNSKNEQQKFMYRGIDAVMNALSPVMSELGLFIVPEVLEQTREERQGRNGGNLLYSILKIKYTMFAPDGSNVSCTVIGEGMDSGDKASNKAMSVGFKYAAFQMFCIPTEEMVDPDAECHEVVPKNAQKQPQKPAQAPAGKTAPAAVTTAAKVPQTAPQTPAQAPAPILVSPVLEYLAKEREALRVARDITKGENNALWKAQIKALTDEKMIPDKPLAEFTRQEAEKLIASMYSCFTPTGTEIKHDDGKTA